MCINAYSICLRTCIHSFCVHNSRRALNRIGLSYTERLLLLNLESLEIRRIKSDLKMCYKIVNGLCDLEVTKFFSFAPISSVTRGHNKKLTLIR